MCIIPPIASAKIRLRYIVISHGDDYSETLRGATVAMIADKDQAGRNHAQLVASKLHGIAASVRVMELPDVNGKPVKDAADFFSAGGTTEQIIELFDRAQEWRPETTQSATNSDFETTKPPIRLNPESCITTSLNNCIPASLHNTTKSVLANIKAKREGLSSLTAKHPNLVRLYTEVIEPRYLAHEHARNDFIVESVPFLYRAVATQFVLELVGCFYDCNRALFNDSRKQHIKEATAMLESVTKTYTESLTVC